MELHCRSCYMLQSGFRPSCLVILSNRQQPQHHTTAVGLQSHGAILTWADSAAVGLVVCADVDQPLQVGTHWACSNQTAHRGHATRASVGGLLEAAAASLRPTAVANVANKAAQDASVDCAATRKCGKGSTADCLSGDFSKYMHMLALLAGVVVALRTHK